MQILFSFFLIVSSASLFSAGPTLHLWIAERFCDMYEITDEDTLRGIIVGAEFPDIRYITRQPRELTHPPVSDIKEVFTGKTPFEIGMKLHVWLDSVRENFIPQEVYEAVASDAEGFSATWLKLIEEEILADFYDGRKWSWYFDTILSEELAFTEEKHIVKWHETIQWTMSVRPSWLIWAQSYLGSAFGIPANVLYKWSYLLSQQKQKPIFQNYMQALLMHLDIALKG